MPSSSISISNSSANPAVQRCLDAARTAYEEAKDNGADNSDANQAARIAFRNVMPYLCGAQNIQDFIACVACGLLRNVMYYEESMKLLYAAQVAAGAIRRQPSPTKERASAASRQHKLPKKESVSASAEGQAS